MEQRAVIIDRQLDFLLDCPDGIQVFDVIDHVKDDSVFFLAGRKGSPYLLFVYNRS